MTRVTGRVIAKALHEAGLIPGDLNDIRRIVIDLQPDDAAIMYLDYFADGEQWLDVVRTFKGIEVRTAISTDPWGDLKGRCDRADAERRAEP